MKIEIYFFTINPNALGKDDAVKTVLDDNKGQGWEKIIELIEKLANSIQEETQVELYFPRTPWKRLTITDLNASELLGKLVETETPDGNSPKLFIIFCEMGDLKANSNTLTLEKNLSMVTQYFRHTCRPEKGIEKLDAVDYQPILCIGTEDIMHLYEHDKEDAYQRTLELDHRVKYLDSSIWNRYLPIDTIDENADPFEDRLKDMLLKFVNWHQDHLYDTVPAVATLEFQTRMLLHSFISRVGEKGHNELVHPFKFHSESRMEEKCLELEKFFDAPREGQSLKQALRWNLLLVDDQGEKKSLSFVGKINYGEKKEINKKQLIEKILFQNGIQHEITPPDDDHKIIDEMLEKMKLGENGRVFDILLLDYLLGDNGEQEREYGHEFLIKLNNNEKVRRGPFGRHWIFPISSFPHAFYDKLVQLGINYFTNWWHLSHGGDPICTPELFRYNLLGFMKQQVCVCYYDAETLKKLISRYHYLEDIDMWAAAVSRMIQHIQAYRDQLKRLVDKSADETHHGLSAGLLNFFKGQKTISKFENKFESIINQIIDGKDWHEIEKNIKQFNASLQWKEYRGVFPLEIMKKINNRKSPILYLSWSGSEKDKTLVNEILDHIIPFENDKKLKFYNIHKVHPSRDIKKERKQVLKAASFFIIFLSSEYRLKEAEYFFNDIINITRKSPGKLAIVNLSDYYNKFTGVDISRHVIFPSTTKYYNDNSKNKISTRKRLSEWLDSILK